jgi:nucleoside-diphosphate-sugar epimerase
MTNKQKTALITGITGQDGSYLAEFLLEKGYVVHGIKRRSSSFNTQRVDHIYQDPHVDNALQPAQPLRRCQDVCVLDYGELPRGLRHLCLQQHFVQPRKPAPGRNLCYPQDHPEDFVIATGVNEVGYWNDQPIIRIDPRYFRTTEVETLLGDPSKAKQKLGWEPEIRLHEMVAEMVTADLTEAKKQSLSKQNGYAVSTSIE